MPAWPKCFLGATYGHYTDYTTALLLRFCIKHVDVGSWRTDLIIIMKLKELESLLENVSTFKSPKILLEQYQTKPHIAARILHTIDTRYNDVAGKVVCDFGCGSGVFAIGVAELGSEITIAIDIDSDALSITQENCSNLDTPPINLIRADLTQPMNWLTRKVDTVVMNPPFGTKRNKGIDMIFLNSALSLNPSAVYSLHKTSTRKHIEKKAVQWNVEMEVIAQLRFDLDSSYKFHKQKSVDIEVDFIRFSPKR